MGAHSSQNHIMATVSSQHVRSAGVLLGMVAGGLLVAHSINAFVVDALYMMPEPPAGVSAVAPEGAPSLASYSPLQAVEQIRSSGLFVLPPSAGDGTTNAASSGRPGATGAAVRASLGLAEKLRLIGVVLGDQRGVFAIIEDLASKQQSLYHLHDSVLDFGEVSDIRRNGIVIRQGNLEELLELAHAEAPPVPGDSAGTTPSLKKPSTSGAPLRKVVDRREVEQAMNDLPKLLSQARAVPNMANGAVNGYRLDYIAPASFYEKIGVQTGDVLQRVNGVDIRDPSTMLSLLQQLKNEQIVKLDVVRNNQRSTITYELR
jgi:general secretion pathway protein C